MKGEIEKSINVLMEKLGLYAVQLSGYLLLFLADIQYQMIVLLLLIAFDTRLAMVFLRRESKRLGVKRRTLFNSNRFNNMIAKTISYFVFIGVGWALMKGLDWQYAVWGASAVPFYSEIRSIDENQRKLGQKGILQDIEDLYHFLLKFKNKQDKLR